MPDVPFSLSAVWLYLSQWDLVERWCSYNAEQAKTRFDAMVVAGLEPLQTRYREITDDPAVIDGLLQQSVEKLRPLVDETMDRVRLVMGHR